MNTIRMALRQARYQNTAFWRNPAAAFFTIVFPLMFLVIFNLLFGSNKVQFEGGTASLSTFYVPGIVVFALVGACYNNIAMYLAFSRDNGLLKRIRGTPLPPGALIAGFVIHSVLLAILLVVIVLAAGVVVYDVDLPTTRMAAFIVTCIVGAATFCALGVAVANFIPNADAAPAIVNASILPLLFISDVFIPMDDAPAWLTTFADIFPVRHFATAMHESFHPFATGSGFEPINLGVMGVWLVVSVVLAMRFFRWERRR